MFTGKTGKTTFSLRFVVTTILVLGTTNDVTNGQSRFQPGSLGAIPGGLASVGQLQPIAPLDPFSGDNALGGQNNGLGQGGFGAPAAGPIARRLGGAAPRGPIVQGLRGAAPGGPIGQGLGGGGPGGPIGQGLGGAAPGGPLGQGLGGAGPGGPVNQRLGGTAPGRLGSRGQVLAPPQLSVELLLVVDELAKDKWALKMPGSTPEVKEQNAIKAMKQFFYSVVHGVNELYASLGKYGLFIDVRIVGMQQINNLWTGTSLAPGKTDQIPANEAIDIFYNWSWRNRKAGFDHALLLTG
ncbi:hypothetical protein ElyMa_004574900 [Elysia marginata]|uniref:Uncharacterized protein n=1 Tax=Elysia marginata TaxID=1093978 RepID=A0AAV4HST2_9GAST|nr:hypothetical protein ElyMa_004574900 [Elysia marginata]